MLVLKVRRISPHDGQRFRGQARDKHGDSLNADGQPQCRWPASRNDAVKPVANALVHHLGTAFHRLDRTYRPPGHPLHLEDKEKRLVHRSQGNMISPQQPFCNGCNKNSIIVKRNVLISGGH